MPTKKRAPQPKTPRTSRVTVEDIYRVDRSAVERQLGYPIKMLAPWPEKSNQQSSGRKDTP